MLKLNKPTLEAKICMEAAGLRFVHAYEGDLNGLQAVLNTQGLPGSLVVDEAIIYLDTTKQSGCHVLNDTAEELFTEVAESLNCAKQDYLNRRLGSYDKWSGNLTPMNLGIVFPDGSVRLCWSKEEAPMSLDKTCVILQRCYEALVNLQAHPYCQSTEDEVNGDVKDTREKRFIECLFKCGVWPDEDNHFTPMSQAQFERTLMKCTKRASVGVPCPQFD